jgi:diguanylate cyclase (GGDEF)-like protein/PAS domain S-box-containing protein
MQKTTEGYEHILFDQDLIGAAMFDGRGVLRRINDRFSAMLGYSSGELEGRKWSELLLSEPDTSSQELWAALVESEVDSCTVERLLTARDGEILDWVISTFRVCGEGEVTEELFVAVIQQITRQNQSETVQSVLFHISRAVSQSMSLSHLLELIHAELGRLFDTTNLYVALYDKGSDSYSFPYSVDQYESLEEIPQQELRRSLTDYVRKTGKPLLADENHLNCLVDEGLVDFVGKTSEVWMGVPLRIEDTVSGVVALQNYSKASIYDQSDLELLSFISENIALAMKRKTFEDALRESEERFRTLQSNLPVGIYRTSENGIMQMANPSLLRIMGYDSFADLELAMLSDVWFDLADRAKLLDTLKTHGTINDYVVRLLRKDRSIFWASYDAHATFSENGSLMFFDAIVQDITEKQEAQQTLFDRNIKLQRANEMLERLARTDSLTGLLNRQYFMQRLQEEMDRSRRYETPLCLLLLDLDHFKVINDTYGHLAGDAALLACVRAITSQMRDSDITGRFGGEEFTMILTQTDLNGATAIAERLCRSIADTEHEFHDMQLTCSIGVAEFTSPLSDVTSFLKLADEALYAAKNSGRNRACIAAKS